MAPGHGLSSPASNRQRRGGDPHRPCARRPSGAPQRADRRQRRRQPGCARRDPGRGLADAGHGSAVPGRRRRAAALPRSPGAEQRSVARRAAGALRPCPAPAGGAAARRPLRSFLARRPGAPGCSRRGRDRGRPPPDGARPGRGPDRAAGLSDARARVAGQIEDWLAELPALEVEERFARRWPNAGGRTPRPEARPWGRIAATSWSTSGLGTPRRACSTGQQKALLVSLVLAEARLRAALGERQPILLLDEVAAHLDAARRAALFEAVAALGAQAWLTGTDAAIFARSAPRPVLPRRECHLAAP